MGDCRVALLIDGDNVSARHASAIHAAAGKIGRLDVSRVYAALVHQSDWIAAPGFRLMHAGSGKNAADLLLCLDAMELAITTEIDTFVLASSDGDFSHLALRLRERGLRVFGFGEQKAPSTFRQACSAFTVLDGAKKGSSTQLDAYSKDCSDFDRQIRTMIAQHSTEGTGMRIAELGPKMSLAHSIRISTFPEKTWRAYLKARPHLYDLDPRGPEAKVRFKPQAFV